MTQGKGSTRRPQQVSDELLAENWERCFGKKWSVKWFPSKGEPIRGEHIVDHIIQLKGPPRATFKFVLDETLPDDTVALMAKDLRKKLGEAYYSEDGPLIDLAEVALGMPDKENDSCTKN